MIIRGGRAQLEKKGAGIVADALRRACALKPLVVLGVVGGTSIGGVLTRLADEEVDWRRVHLFMADERLVALDHPENNFQFVVSCLSPFFPAANLHPFCGGENADATSLSQYRQDLSDYGGRFDVVVLSAGEDGHVASLFPAHQTVRDEAPFFIITRSAPKPPPGRMSASRTLLQQSDAAVLLIFGAAKQAALNNYLNDQYDVERCPAKLVQAVNEHFILTDCGVPSR